MSNNKSKCIDMKGQRFSHLTVMERSGNKEGQATWLCKCDCGNEVIVRRSTLTQGHQKTCGKIDCRFHGDDLTGKKFGKLTVLELSKPDSSRYKMWLCKCDCGNEKIVRGWHLTGGKIVSCGCYKRGRSSEVNKTHGMSNTRIYRIRQHIKDRCLNPNDKSYKNYGGRGITICDEWASDFMSFYNWSMENGYEENLTIDRIDNNGNYEPSNCRWVTLEVQANNKRNNHIIEWNGKSQTMADWSKELGLTQDSLERRINRGVLSLDECMTMPPQNKVRTNKEEIS